MSVENTLPWEIACHLSGFHPRVTGLVEALRLVKSANVVGLLRQPGDAENPGRGVFRRSGDRDLLPGQFGPDQNHTGDAASPGCAGR